MRPTSVKVVQHSKYKCEKCEKQFAKNDTQRIFLEGRNMTVCKSCRYKLIPRGQYE